MTDRTDSQRRRSKENLDTLVKQAQELAASVEEEYLESEPMRRANETLDALEKCLDARDARINAQDARINALQTRTDEELAKLRREMASFKALAVKQGIVPDDSP